MLKLQIGQVENSIAESLEFKFLNRELKVEKRMRAVGLSAQVWVFI